jgi:hypothetical protein
VEETRTSAITRFEGQNNTKAFQGGKVGNEKQARGRGQGVAAGVQHKFMLQNKWQ